MAKSTVFPKKHLVFKTIVKPSSRGGFTLGAVLQNHPLGVVSQNHPSLKRMYFFDIDRLIEFFSFSDDSILYFWRRLYVWIHFLHADSVSLEQS